MLAETCKHSQTIEIFYPCKESVIFEWGVLQIVVTIWPLPLLISSLYETTFWKLNLYA